MTRLNRVLDRVGHHGENRARIRLDMDRSSTKYHRICVAWPDNQASGRERIPVEGDHGKMYVM